MERLSLRQSMGRRWGRGPSDPAAPEAEARPAGATRKRKRAALIGGLIIAGLLLAGIAGAVSPRASTTTALTPPRDLPGLSETGVDATGPAKGPGGVANLDGPQSGGPGATAGWDRKIIRAATLQLTVRSVTTSLEQVRALAGAHSGYVSQSESHQSGDYTVATITLQVPVQEFDNVIPLLRQMGLKPAQETISSSDVTEEYVDLQAQLRNLQATEARLLALQQKADALDDVLAVDRELRQVQGDIEQAQGRLNYLSTRAAMSTIAVSLYPEALPAPVSTEPAWDPVSIADHAWAASLDLLAGAAGVLITVAVFLWWTVPLLLVAWLFFRRPRRPSATT